MQRASSNFFIQIWLFGRRPTERKGLIAQINATSTERLVEKRQIVISSMFFYLQLQDANKQQFRSIAV